MYFCYDWDMKLYVARHGQTNYNVLGLCNSDPKVDVHLTEIGKGQAEKLAQRLEGVEIDKVFVSELRRTQQTAEFFNKFHNAEVTVDARLNDISFGYEGRPYAEYRSALDKAEDMWTARFNGGESIKDLRERAQNFLDDLKPKDYGSVLVVTSGGVIQAIYGILNNLSIEEAWSFRPDKGSCIELELR